MKRLICIALCLVLSACDGQGVRSRDAGALGGAALGAGLGAIVGHATGHLGEGIAIGAGVGALTGGLVGNEMDRENDALDDREQRIDDNDRRLRDNRRLIDELRNDGVDARQTRRGVVINLPDVFFEFDRADLTPEARGVSRHIADALSHDRRRPISVEGHTDSIGTAAYNKSLSERRARSVANALTREGVPSRRIAVRGLGESEPVASNRTASGRQQNRRVEVIIEDR